MNKIRWPIALMVLGILVLALPLVASADNSWSKYHWDISTDESIADPLDFGDNLTTAAWTSSLAGASTDWNASVLQNEILANGSNQACDPVLGGVEVCNAAYGDNGWLGIAQIWIYRGRSGHIAQGLVKVNDTYFNTPDYDTQAWRDYVMCQEVGHTLGLAHQDENFDEPNLGTCMDYTSNPLGPPSNVSPDPHDYEELTKIYGHLNGIEDDGSGGGNGNGNNGRGNGNSGGAPGQEVRQWGKAISTDGKGRPDLFEQTLGNGDKVFTHVLWAD